MTSREPPLLPEGEPRYSPPARGGVAAKQRGWWEELRALEILADVRQNPFKIFHHIPILQPDDGQAHRTKKPFSRFVMAGRVFAIVRSSFKFNDQPFGCAIEVDDVRPDALLASEFSVIQK